MDITTVINIVALSLTGIIGVGWIVSLRRQKTLGKQLATLEEQLQLHQQSIRGLTAGAVGMDKRLQQIGADEKRLSERQDTFENQQIPEVPYGHAIRLVQQGAGPRRLIEELGLSESEALLIQHMHGKKESA